MTEAILTALGLVLGVAATLVSLLHDETPSRTKMVLSVLALLGLGAGLIGTRIQYKDRVSDRRCGGGSKEPTQGDSGESWRCRGAR
jgi:hypothetical protein